jgi:hypothetical protein
MHVPFHSRVLNGAEYVPCDALKRRAGGSLAAGRRSLVVPKINAWRIVKKNRTFSSSFARTGSSYCRGCEPCTGRDTTEETVQCVSECKLLIRASRLRANSVGNYEMKLPFIKRFCPLFIMLLPAVLGAQPAPADQSGPPPESLNIIVVEGEGTINNTREHAPPAITIRVEDEKKRPVSGAVIVFALPTDGPSGVFRDGAKTLTLTTDKEGTVSVRGLKPNRLSGQMQIHLNASYRGRTARARITQFNMAVPSAKGGSSKLLVIVALVGAAAAGGAYAGLHKGGSSGSSVTGPPTSGPIPISINPGTGTVGPPQ